MKKRATFVILMVAMITVLACGTHTSASTEKSIKNQTTKLEFEKSGCLNMEGFGYEYGIYRFDAPNEDIVAYAINADTGCIIFGKNEWPAQTSVGTSFFNENSIFLGISNTYALFLDEDEEIIALPIKERQDAKIGENTRNKIPYDELTQEEKDSFVFPISYKKVSNTFLSEI